MLQPKAYLGLVALLFADIGVVNANETAAYFISAKSGMINYVEGEPTVSNPELSQPQPVAPRHQLVKGDVLQTTGDQRVEMLLNPGTYLRVAENSRVRVLATAFDDMRFALEEGIAIVESLSLRRKVHRLQVQTPSGDLRVLKKGLYRFAVDADGQVQVTVFDGKLRWTRDQVKIAALKSGKTFNLSRSARGRLRYSKVGKDFFDDIDRWSRERAVALIAANSKIPSWMSRSALSRYGFRSNGGWVYDPFSRMYTFIPFHFLLRSPYGLAYGNYTPTWRSYGPVYASRGNGGSILGRSSSTYIPATTSVHRSSAATSTSSSIAAGSGAQQSRAAASSSVRGR